MLCGVGLGLHHCLNQVCYKRRLMGGLECKFRQNAIFRIILYCIPRLWLDPGRASGRI